MNILLTPTLTQFLTDEGYGYCLIKNARSDFSFTMLTPVHVKPTLEQLNSSFDAVLTTTNLQYLLEEMNDEFILVNLDRTTLLAYIGSLIRATAKKSTHITKH